VSQRYENLRKELRAAPKTWLVTGVAGFIGSNLLEALLRLGQRVTGLDNFATGFPHNLDDVRAAVGARAWSGFTLLEGDIARVDDCREAIRGADYVLHQAALGSVPRSIADPIATNRANVGGFLNMLVAAKDEGVTRFVYAGSSSTYGDHPALPKLEDRIGKPMSPYAVSKYVGELYSEVFAKVYGLEVTGLRYFNVFGRRQNPAGAYAAVIPKWVGQLLAGERCVINGDGETSRDFSYIDNVVQANLLAAGAEPGEAGHQVCHQVCHQVYNVACGERTTLSELYGLIRDGLARLRPELAGLASREPLYAPFRPGDVRHSLADIAKARRRLGYAPSHTVREGLDEALAWFAARAQEAQKPAR
jgi:UDP-N-acetylglucosamine 4-epimerase